MYYRREAGAAEEAHKKQEKHLRVESRALDGKIERRETFRAMWMRLLSRNPTYSVALEADMGLEGVDCGSLLGLCIDKQTTSHWRDPKQ